MILKEKYAKETDKEADKINKTIISNDAFAVCEFIEILINQIEISRLK